ncbi:Phenylacetic acid catabolic protein [Escherichia coli]
MWRFTAELFDADEIDIALSEEGIAVDSRTLRAAWEAEVFAGINEATLTCCKSRRIALAVKKDWSPKTLANAGRNAVSPACLARSAVVTEEMGMQRLGHHCTAAGA